MYLHELIIGNNPITTTLITHDYIYLISVFVIAGYPDKLNKYEKSLLAIKLWVTFGRNGVVHVLSPEIYACLF